MAGSSASPALSRNQQLYTQTIHTTIPHRINRNNGLLICATRWLLKNQIGLSCAFVGLLFLTHISLPTARPYTSKFFTLSHYNPSTGKYAAGHGDFYFMAFCVVLLTGLRAGCMDHILAPLARHWGVRKTKDATRFAEQGWMLVYYNVFWPLGMYLYSNSPYFLTMREPWTDWPQREIDGLIKAYLLGQRAFWIQQVLVINIEDRRKDHWQMLTHHFVTIALIAASYAYHPTRVANLIMVLMDVIDLFLPLAKCLKYLGFTTIGDVVFGLFIVSWLLARHVFSLTACWSIYHDLPRVTPPGCYSGTADNLHGPFPVPNDWSHLLDPFRDPAGTICLNENIRYGLLSFLLVLQVMMVLWFGFIARVAVRVLQGNRAEDLRSDGEEADGDCLEDHAAGVTGIEVGAEDAAGMGYERGSGVDKTASVGVRSRKELLNRIG